MRALGAMPQTFFGKKLSDPYKISLICPVKNTYKILLAFGGSSILVEQIPRSCTLTNHKNIFTAKL